MGEVDKPPPPTVGLGGGDTAPRFMGPGANKSCQNSRKERRITAQRVRYVRIVLTKPTLRFEPTCLESQLLLQYFACVHFYNISLRRSVFCIIWKGFHFTNMVHRFLVYYAHELDL